MFMIIMLSSMAIWVFLAVGGFEHRVDLLESYIERRGITLPAGIMQQKVFLVNRGCRYWRRYEPLYAHDHVIGSICLAFQVNVPLYTIGA